MRGNSSWHSQGVPFPTIYIYCTSHMSWKRLESRVVNTCVYLSMHCIRNDQWCCNHILCLERGLGQTCSPYVFHPSIPFVAIVITANLRTKILDFRGFDSSIILIWRGGIPRPDPGNSESSNLSRDNIDREIGRSMPSICTRQPSSYSHELDPR